MGPLSLLSIAGGCWQWTPHYLHEGKFQCCTPVLLSLQAWPPLNKLFLCMGASCSELLCAPDEP